MARVGNPGLEGLTKQYEAISRVADTVSELRRGGATRESPALQTVERELHALVVEFQRDAGDFSTTSRSELKSFREIGDNLGTVMSKVQGAVAFGAKSQPVYAQSVSHEIEFGQFRNRDGMLTFLLEQAQNDPRGLAHSGFWGDRTFVAKRGDDVQAVLNRAEKFYADDGVRDLWNADLAVVRREGVLEAALGPEAPVVRTEQQLVADLRAMGGDFVRNAVDTIRSPDEAAVFLSWAMRDYAKIGYRGANPAKALRENIEVIRDLHGTAPAAWSSKVLDRFF